MRQPQLKAPVAFFVFNRPHTTARVFEAIRRAAPATLLLVADGPRPGRPDEAEKCAAVREIVSRIDWPCRVLSNFSEENQGCRQRMSSGLGWVFDTVEEAIILEDDCLPDQSFFRFCDELLDRYRDDGRIMMISGDNFHRGAHPLAESYYFSRYPHIWGWAAWRRSWKHYDVRIGAWPAVREDKGLERMFGDRRLARFWREAFESVHSGGLDTWDHQFTFCCFMHAGLCIMPRVNLVSNIGFGADATHTKSRSDAAELAVETMTFPLRHPALVARDACADALTERNHILPQRGSILAGAAHRLLGPLRRLFQKAAPSPSGLDAPSELSVKRGGDGG